MGKSSPANHLVVFSDTHSGSTLALCPPRYKLDEGGYYDLSPAQQCLWDKWKEFWTEFVPSVTKGEPFDVLDNGDCCEGIHHNTTQLITPGETDQIKIAVRLRRPILDKCNNYTIIRGTPSHAGSLSWREEAVAMKLFNEDEGPQTYFDAMLPVGDYTVHAAHHIGGTSSYASIFTALAKEIAACIMNASRFGATVPDIIVRSHVHNEKTCSLPYQDRRVTALSTPAWQLKTEYGWKHFRFDTPQIGGMVISATKYEPVIRRFLWAPPSTGKIIHPTRGKPSSSRSATKRPRKD